MMVNRYDFLGTTEGFEKTAQGFLRAKANLTRTGIFSYKSDSGIVRELRTDSEVFSAAKSFFIALKIKVERYQPLF